MQRYRFSEGFLVIEIIMTHLLNSFFKTIYCQKDSMANFHHDQGKYVENFESSQQHVY